MEIIGREAEKTVLQGCLDSQRPEFVAVYGRRRVGKTYLIREFLRDNMVFSLTGAVKTSMKQQLLLFDEALRDWGGRDMSAAKNWYEAFRLLKEHIRHIRGKRKKVVFLDEIPWLATQKSGFLAALDHFWNSFGATREDILLVICGSASSWIIDNVVRDRGGLHNRLTRRILVEPFTLAECERYYRFKGIDLNRIQITQLYMVIGGIPYYMDCVERGKSPEQIIDSLFFAKGAPLADEYGNLYASLFKNPERHLRIIEVLSNKMAGLTQQELFTRLEAKPGGSLVKSLNELEQCGFIRRYHEFTKRKSGCYYQLVDFYTLFYLKHVRGLLLPKPRYWQNLSRKGGWSAWNGLAFERVCAAHVEQIKDKLGILGVNTEVSGWRSKNADPGVQIDMVLKRDDRIIDLCEMKFTERPFAIDATYDQELLCKRETFREETKTKDALHVVIVSASGLTEGSYRGMVQFLVTLNDLFADN